jgi:hypothetical protein
MRLSVVLQDVLSKRLQLKIKNEEAYLVRMQEDGHGSSSDNGAHLWV